MLLHIFGDTGGLWDGLKLLEPLAGYRLAETGIPVEARYCASEGKAVLQVISHAGTARVEYTGRVQFFRGLGLLLEHWQDGESEFALTEPVLFDSDGVMIDVSQWNALPRPETLRELLCRMALMGLSRLMLYLEDSYEVEGEPWFGYLRGRYSREDLCRIDDWADRLGIEVVPAIQTLSHLGEVLKWDRYAALQENRETLLPGEEQSYRLIEQMLDALQGCFRSRVIHVGMDEAWGLGRGTSMDRYGEVSVYGLMLQHLRRVAGLCAQRGLRPMIWSDMFFRSGSEGAMGYGNDFYTTAVISAELVRDMPSNVQLVFWEYNRDQEDFYRNAIQKHRQFGSLPVFAGGIWNWEGFGVNYGLTMDAGNAALRACKKEGVREVLATLWGDDATENLLFSNLLGLQFWAEHCYAEEVEPAKLARRFAFCTGGQAADFLALQLLDAVPGVEERNAGMSNPSKYLLWQNVLLGVFDWHAQGKNLSEHYASLAARMEQAVGRNGSYGSVFKVCAALCRVLELKADLGVRIRRAYEDGRRTELQHLVQEELPLLQERLTVLHDLHREQWYAGNLPFGWEVTDLRYGAAIQSIGTARWRLEQYLCGKVTALPELEQRRLPFDGTEGWPAVYRYWQMPTTSRLSQP